MEDASGVYNSTTISFESPNNVHLQAPSAGGGGGGRRAWNLSEMVNPPAERSRWFHWTTLMGGSITLGLGLIVIVIGIYNQHYYDPQSQNVRNNEPESGPSHWMVILIGFGLVLFGLLLLVIYCRMVNVSTDRLLCNPLSRTRNALRQVTKPRQGSNLLSNPNHPILSPQDLAFRNANGEVTSEEKANLMANEVKEGPKPYFPHRSTPSSSRSRTTTPGPVGAQSKATTLPSQFPVQVQPYMRPLYQNPVEDEEDFPEFPPVRPPRQKDREKGSQLRRDVDPFPSQGQGPSHYKARHFAGHGYGSGKLPSGMVGAKAPLASIEDMTPSLRSSFASVMMYPPSDWGASEDEGDEGAGFEDNASFDSTIMLDLERGQKGMSASEQGIQGFFEVPPVPDSEFRRFEDFRRVSPGKGRKASLSSLSVQSAL